MKHNREHSCQTKPCKPMVTKIDLAMKRMKRGWLTTLQSIHEIGLSSLSQRVSVKRREGVNIIDKWVKTESGSRVKAYRLG